MSFFYNEKWQKWNGSWQVIGTDGTTVMSVPASVVQSAVDNSQSGEAPQGE